MADWLTKKQAAELLEVSVAELEAMAAPCARKGPMVRYDKAKLLAWVEAQFDDPANNPETSEGWQIIEPGSTDVDDIWQGSPKGQNILAPDGTAARKEPVTTMKFGRGDVTVQGDDGVPYRILDGMNAPEWSAGVDQFEDEEIQKTLAAGGSRSLNPSPLEGAQVKPRPDDTSLDGVPDSIISGAVNQ